MLYENLMVFFFCEILQACYFANPLPVESASTVLVYDRKARSGIRVYETVDYPLKALMFTSNNANTLANVVSEACLALHENNTAHSLMISNNGRNVFLFPQVNLVEAQSSISKNNYGMVMY